MNITKTFPILLAAAALVAPAPASAVTFTGSGAGYATSIRLTMPPPSGMVRVELAECPGLPAADGCLSGDAVYLRNVTDRGVLAHEMGHVFAERNLDGRERAVLGYWLLKGVEWGDCGDVQTIVPQSAQAPGGYGHCPAELFGEAYAACALGQLPDRQRQDGGMLWATFDWPRAYGWMPSLKRHRKVCGMIRAFA